MGLPVVVVLLIYLGKNGDQDTGERKTLVSISWNILSCEFMLANFSFGGNFEPEDGEDDEHVAEDGGEAEAEQHAEQEDVLEARRHRHCEERVVLRDSKWVSDDDL